MHKKEIQGVILAGGSGKRLWPLSRHALPKQFIKVQPNKTLLEATIDRCINLVHGADSLPGLCVVTTREHEQFLTALLHKASFRLLVEPSSRNTAAAILFSVLSLIHESPENLDNIIFFVPSDHVIAHDQLFIQKLDQAIRCAQLYDSIILLGVNPTFPSTHYGYIQKNIKISDELYGVRHFYEKPTRVCAEQYLQTGTMLWNTGIFCAKASVFMRDFKQHAPELFHAMYAYFIEGSSYDLIPACSFDKAVLEKAESLLVVQGEFAWSDVGNIEQFMAARQETELDAPKVLCYKSKNNIVEVKNKLVVLADVHDLCIIETEDILFIGQRNGSDNSDNALDLLDYLKKSGYEQYL